MTFRDLLADTLRTLWAHKLRTSLTMFGIAWGIVSITLMVAAGEGLRVGQQIQADNLGKALLVFFAGRTSMQAGGLRAGHLVRFEDTDPAVIRAEAPACRLVLPELMQSNIPVRTARNSGFFSISGSEPEFGDLRSLAVAEGRYFNRRDELEARRVAFLGSDVRKQLFGGDAAAGQQISLGGFPYEVVGVMQHKEQDSDYDTKDVFKIFIPFRAAIRDFPNKPPYPPRSIDVILATAHSPQLHEACRAQAIRTLARLHRFDPADEEAVRVMDMVKEAELFRQMTDGMKYFLGAVGVVTLFLGGIGVMNVMLVAVRERTREIGVRKAVGATSRGILLQFFAETLIVVFLSGGLGLAVAHAICALVNLLPMPPFFAGLLATWRTGALSAALLGAVALASALYPASRAATVDPIEALRYEVGG